MKVVFGVPSYHAAPALEFTMSALETQMLCQERGISTIWHYLPGDPYVHKARSKIGSAFLTDYPDADALFFLDDDVGWEAAAVVRLLERPEDVVVGVYPKKNDDKVEFPVELFHDNGKFVERDGLFLGNLVPTGFMRIKRRVLERAAEESGVYPELDKAKGWIEVWDLFRTGFVPDKPDGKRGRWWGEDFFFSFMVRHLGFDVWVDPDIRFSHRGSKAWVARFADHLVPLEPANG